MLLKIAAAKIAILSIEYILFRFLVKYQIRNESIRLKG